MTRSNPTRKDLKEVLSGTIKHTLRAKLGGPMGVVRNNRSYFGWRITNFDTVDNLATYITFENTDGTERHFEIRLKEVKMK